MPSDYSSFWPAIETLADTLRDDDPQLTGTLRQVMRVFNTLPEEQQTKLRLDVQILTVQVSRLALAMTRKLDEQSSHGTENA